MFNNIDIKENYNINFEEAKKMPIYKFGFENINSLKELIKKIEIKDFQDDKTVVAVLKFGNIDIEINVFCYDDIFELEYYICTNDSKIGWSSYSESGTKVTLDDNIEETMFNELMKFAKEQKLNWSTFNN